MEVDTFRTASSDRTFWSSSRQLRQRRNSLNSWRTGSNCGSGEKFGQKTREHASQITPSHQVLPKFLTTDISRAQKQWLNGSPRIHQLQKPRISLRWNTRLSYLPARHGNSYCSIWGENPPLSGDIWIYVPWLKSDLTLGLTYYITH